MLDGRPCRHRAAILAKGFEVITWMAQRFMRRWRERHPSPIWLDQKKHLAGWPIGAWSYGDFQAIAFDPGDSITVGKYCSFSSGIKILLGGEHRSDCVTTYPFRYLWPEAKGLPPSRFTKGSVTIGNDVWVGMDVTILSGVEIGNGAIIGARAVVAKSVPPYGVVVGNPGRVIKYRFDSATISALERIAWWNWSDDRVREALPRLASDPAEFIATYGDQPGDIDP